MRYYLFMDIITSLDNKQVKYWNKLHHKKYRDENYLILDERIVIKAYQEGYLKTLIYLDDKPFIFDNAYKVNKEVLFKISKDNSLSFIGIGNKIKEKEYHHKRIILLDELQDPLNIGMIIECAKVFGFHDIILSLNCSDIYHEKCLKASKGYIYDLNIIRRDLKEEIIKLKNDNYKIYATGLSDNTISYLDVKIDDKIAFILGNEGSGVREEIMKISDEIIKIDMANIDSLNVAMAAAIIMHKFKNEQ